MSPAWAKAAGSTESVNVAGLISVPPRSSNETERPADEIAGLAAPGFPFNPRLVSTCGPSVRATSCPSALTAPGGIMSVAPVRRTVPSWATVIGISAEVTSTGRIAVVPPPDWCTAITTVAVTTTNTATIATTRTRLLTIHSPGLEGMAYSRPRSRPVDQLVQGMRDGANGLLEEPSDMFARTTAEPRLVVTLSLIHI